jgi:hypothetical protein
MLDDSFRGSDRVSRPDSQNQCDTASVGDEDFEFAMGTSTPFESAMPTLSCFGSANQVPTP